MRERINKSKLHLEEDFNQVIYPETSIDQVQGLEAELSNFENKQDTLVSGENIKTINGQSILGGGDIEISGGSSKLYKHKITCIYEQRSKKTIGYVLSSKSTPFTNDEIYNGSTLDGCVCVNGEYNEDDDNLVNGFVYISDWMGYSITDNVGLILFEPNGTTTDEVLGEI